MPEEILILVLSFLGMLTGVIIVTTFIRLLFKYLHARNNAKHLPDSSLTMTDLKEALREVVEDANQPLLERIENLENRIDPELLSLPDEEAVTKTICRTNARIS